MALFNINITGYDNKPPTIGDGERSTNYGEPIVLTRADFTTNTTPPYYDPEGDLPLNLKITSLPASGILKLNGVDVTVNQEISFVDSIDAGLLTYTPDMNNLDAHNVDFNFEISDAGSQQYVS
jgi:large repetitive protein